MKDNVRIGALNVPLPSDPKTDKSVDVRYTYDTSGILEVEATVLATKKLHRLVIEGNPGAMAQDEIEKRLKALSALKIHPRDEQENAATIATDLAAVGIIIGAFANNLFKTAIGVWLGHARLRLPLLLGMVPMLLAGGAALLWLVLQ